MSKRPPGQLTFTLILQPEKHCDDPVRMLRQLLKVALRRFGFKCIAVAEGRRP
jgi:hypothetical protein